MGGVVSVACLGFLVREVVLEFRWVELGFFSLECNEVPLMSYEISVGLE